MQTLNLHYTAATLVHDARSQHTTAAALPAVAAGSMHLTQTKVVSPKHPPNLPTPPKPHAKPPTYGDLKTTAAAAGPPQRASS